MMHWKQFIAFHSFELIYLAVLAILPFIVSLWIIASGSIMLLSFFGAKAVYRKVIFRSIPVDGQAVVITGCDTGFGHALSKRLDYLGFTVIAGCLDENGEGADALRKWSDTGRIHVLQVDVTSDESVNKLENYVRKHCHKGVWALVNNAAINFVGDIEFCTMAQYKMVAEVNQFGVIRVTKAFLPHIRMSKGRVVNVTSAKGCICLPSNAVYGATKYAIEAFSDVLRLEMMKFGVKVVIVEPGDFGGTTGMLSAKTLKWLKDEMNIMWDSASPEVKKTYGKEYFESIYTGTEVAAKEAAKTMAAVIDAMEDAVVNVKPSVRYLVDGSNRLIDFNNWLIRIRPFIPDTMLDFFLDKKYNQGLPPLSNARPLPDSRDSSKIR